ncbi:hypothetical protein [Vandammella animalimorsus]|uniref:hypothetical protein n=1 Tax=Vandammella animalimorsus TaxID=2029117 RepID=UPI0011C3E8D8|nr:hypothetical protein [Vandammella animalimorsus]
MIGEVMGLTCSGGALFRLLACLSLFFVLLAGCSNAKSIKKSCEMGAVPEEVILERAGDGKNSYDRGEWDVYIDVLDCGYRIILRRKGHESSGVKTIILDKDLNFVYSFR